MSDQNFISANRANWDDRVDGHLVAYGAEAFADSPGEISEVVREDMALMAPHLPNGSAHGLRLVHLQCHIGTDTISWARLGALATGLDFSPKSLEAARMLAERASDDDCSAGRRAAVNVVRRAARGAMELVPRLGNRRHGWMLADRLERLPLTFRSPRGGRAETADVRPRLVGSAQAVMPARSVLAVATFCRNVRHRDRG